MLVQIQKILNLTSCPSCGKKNVLQANLSCGRDDKKCTTTCQCNDCGIHLILQIPENMDTEQFLNEKVKLDCRIESSSCELVGLEGQLAKAG